MADPGATGGQGPTMKRLTYSPNIVHQLLIDHGMNASHQSQ